MLISNVFPCSGAFCATLHCFSMGGKISPAFSFPLVCDNVSYFACHIHSRHVPLTPFSVQGHTQSSKKFSTLDTALFSFPKMKANVIMLTSAF